MKKVKAFFKFRDASFKKGLMFFEKGLGSFRQQKKQGREERFPTTLKTISGTNRRGRSGKIRAECHFFIIFLPNVLCISKITITFAQQF